MKKIGEQLRAAGVVPWLDEEQLPLCKRDQTVRVWDVRTGNDKLTYNAHNAEVDAVAWSPDSRYIVSGSFDDGNPANSSVQVWDANTGCRAFSISGHDRVRSVAWSPDGTLIAPGHGNQFAYVWDRTGNEAFTYHGHTNWVHAVA